MLAKLENLVNSAKGFLIWIVTPLAFVAGFIFYLLNSNSELKAKVGQSKEEVKLNELKTEETAVDKEADSSLSAYDSVRDAYLKKHPSERE